MINATSRMATSLFDLSGKTAMVSGGTRGIGQAIAIALAEAGADIILIQVNIWSDVMSPQAHTNISSKRSETDSTTQMAVEVLNRGCWIETCELGDKDDVATLVSRVTAKYPRIDILVNVAGIQRRDAATDYAQETFDEVMQINLASTFTICRDMGKYWIDGGVPGKIINTASLASFIGSVRIVGYAMSKGGVAQLTKTLSNEWASKGINVNAIAPG